MLDGSTLFARALEAALGPASDGRISVVGTAATIGEGLHLVDDTSPDLVLVDLGLPPTGAIELLGVLRCRPFAPRVLVMSSTDHVESVAGALEAGADAFVSKSSRPDELLAPLVAVLQGWAVAPRPFVDHLLARYRRPGEDLASKLGARDRELWILVAEGHDVTAIAERLYVSERTAKRLVADLRGRLGVRTRIEMASLAGRAGLLDDRIIGRVPVDTPPRRPGAWRPRPSNGAPPAIGGEAS